MIIANLSYDIRSLRTCTLTCYSWYIAAVPHLHYNLFIDDCWGQKFQWPYRLRRTHRLGLLPLIKTFGSVGPTATHFPQSGSAIISYTNFRH